MGAAYRCEVCSGPNIWNIERWGDAVVSWACADHLSAVCEALQRDFEVTKLQVKYDPKVSEWAQIGQTLEKIKDSAG